MGAKLYADTTNKVLVVTEAPDVNGFVFVDAQEEVWSDLIIDWEGDVNLRKHTFPVVAIGGDTISAGKLGTTYVLRTPWQITPYESDQDFVIDGNLFTESALTKLVLPTVGGYTVTVTRNLSTLVEVVESGTSGLTAAETAVLVKIDKLLTNRMVTDPTTGVMTIYDDDDVTPAYEGDIFEDTAEAQPYRGRGIEERKRLT